MSYLQQLAAAANTMGAPPTPGPPNIGTPPPIPSTEPPPYDAAMDPAWKGLLDPNRHDLRSFLNELSPEHRQMLLQEFMKHRARPAATMAPIPGPQLPQGAPLPPPSL